MPQMSPLSWVTIFVTLAFLMVMMINLFPNLKTKNMIFLSLKKKENNMKW